MRTPATRRLAASGAVQRSAEDRRAARRVPARLFVLRRSSRLRGRRVVFGLKGSRQGSFRPSSPRCEGRRLLTDSCRKFEGSEESVRQPSQGASSGEKKPSDRLPGSEERVCRSAPPTAEGGALACMKVESRAEASAVPDGKNGRSRVWWQVATISSVCCFSVSNGGLYTVRPLQKEGYSRSDFPSVMNPPHEK